MDNGVTCWSLLNSRLLSYVRDSLVAWNEYIQNFLSSSGTVLDVHDACWRRMDFLSRELRAGITEFGSQISFGTAEGLTDWRHEFGDDKREVGKCHSNNLIGQWALLASHPGDL